MSYANSRVVSYNVHNACHRRSIKYSSAYEIRLYFNEAFKLSSISIGIFAIDEIIWNFLRRKYEYVD